MKTQTKSTASRGIMHSKRTIPSIGVVQLIVIAILMFLALPPMVSSKAINKTERINDDLCKVSKMIDNIIGRLDDGYMTESDNCTGYVNDFEGQMLRADNRTAIDLKKLKESNENMERRLSARIQENGREAEELSGGIKQLIAADNRTAIDVKKLKESIENMESRLSAKIEKNDRAASNTADKLKTYIDETIRFSYYMTTWSRSGNVLYKLFTYPEVNYATAQKNCQKHGGTLAAKVLRDPYVVRDIATKTIIRPSKWRGPWIGFDDIKREGEWKWLDGGKTSSETTEWHQIQPDNYKGKEDCAVIIEVKNGKSILNDLSCRSTESYLCEMEIPEQSWIHQ